MNRPLKLAVVSALLGCGLCGCSSLTVNTPVATVDPSELTAPRALELDIRGEPSRTFTVTSDASARPPTFDNTSLPAGLLTGELNYGLADRLQIGGGFTAGLGLVGNIGFQFLGEPWQEGQTGWSGAVRAKILVDTVNNSGNQNGEFGPGGYPWKASSELTSGEVGLSLGYRWNPSCSGFFGVSYNQFSDNSKIQQDPTSDGTNAGGTYTANNTGHSTATGFGFLFGSGGIRAIPVLEWVDYSIESQRFQEARWGLTLAFGGTQNKKAP